MEKSLVAELLGKIASAEERWAETDVSVEVFSSGSGWVHRPHRPAMNFATIDECLEMLSK